MGKSDTQFKNDLRHQKIMLQEILKLAKENEIDKLEEKIKIELQRIEETLQD